MKDVKLVYKNNTTNKIYYKFGNDIVTGKDKLIQDIVISLLTETGSNLYSPNFGTNFIKQVNSHSYNTKIPDELEVILNLAIENTKKNIIKKQIEAISYGNVIPNDELLVNLELTSIVYNDQLYKWDVEITVTTENETIKVGI